MVSTSGMITRLRPGRLMLLFLAAYISVFAIMSRYSAILDSKFGRPTIGYAVGTAIVLGFIIYYRLLQELCSSPESGPSISTKPPHKGPKPSTEHASTEFRISPWPWLKAVGAMLAMISIPVLVLWALNLERFPLAQRFSIPLSLLGLAALSVVLFGALFAMNYRLIGFRVGADGCDFRLGPMQGADVKSVISTRYGAFSIDRVGKLWSRERLSPVLKWKQTDYGITFKAGDQLHLGTKGWLDTDFAALDWEALLEELSRRSGVAIERDKLA